MPMNPLLLGTLLNTGSQLLGNAFQFGSDQHFANQQSDWNFQNQQLQNQFNLDMWHRANEYNSPQAQMARFAEAGLNPHLIYGKGTPGNTQPTKSADIKPYTRAEGVNVTEGLNAFGDFVQFKNIQAQTDNTKAGTRVLEEKAILQQLDQVSKFLKNNKDWIDLKRYDALQEHNLNIAEQRLNNLRLTGDNLGETNRKLSADADLAEKTIDKKIELLETQLANAKTDGDIKKAILAIKQFQAELAEYGATEHDSVIMRVIIKALNAMFNMELSVPDNYQVPQGGFQKQQQYLK